MPIERYDMNARLYLRLGLMASSTLIRKAGCNANDLKFPEYVQTCIEFYNILIYEFARAMLPYGIFMWRP